MQSQGILNAYLTRSRQGRLRPSQRSRKQGHGHQLTEEPPSATETDAHYQPTTERRNAELLKFLHPPRPASTPGGTRPRIYADMTKQAHLLIAGKTGAGKSVVINGIIYSLLIDSFPTECGLILIDPKRVELSQWKNTPHCIRYASEPGEPAQALQTALDITEDRFRQMQR